VILHHKKANKKQVTQITMVGIPNPTEAVATGVRVATGIGIDVASYGAAKVFPNVVERAPETTPAAGANLYEIAVRESINIIVSVFVTDDHIQELTNTV
jgi:hypothetical protein